MPRFSRLLPVIFALIVVAIFALPEASGQTATPDYDLVGGGHFYTEANGGAGSQYGYRITDEAGIGFWSEFKRLGGVNVLGYPSSKRFILDGFVVQATQKVIMQWRPDVNPPQVYFINVFDKLHDMNMDSVLQATYQIPPQIDSSFDAGKTPDQIQSARLGLLSTDPAIAARYNASGATSVLYNGLPTSTITNEGAFVTLRAQRIAIQHWSAANPAAGIKPGDVTVVNGGDIAKALGLVPASAAVPETSTGVSAATPTPVAPTPTPTPAFAYHSKEVTDPPVDCNGDPNVSAIPCLAQAPNAGSQYIKGRIMDPKGNHLQGVTVQATVAGSVLQFVSAGDGTFTFNIAGAGSPTGSCPPYSLTYQIMVLDDKGGQASDIRSVTYNGNCNVAGEFHFDFVRNF